MKKKHLILVFALVAVMAMSLTACGRRSDNTIVEETTNVEEPAADTGGESGGGSGDTGNGDTSNGGDSQQDDGPVVEDPFGNEGGDQGDDGDSGDDDVPAPAIE
ncbi:MAG: hypothetical protein LIO56_08065 [Lachnospiraceae bacterium]|nr:hypothetical protein [Lachnospiraceae bacterium]